MKIGALLHLGTHTRPDILFEVNSISRSINQPSKATYCRINRVLNYVKSTSTHGITLSGANDISKITTYTDADWGGKTTDQQEHNESRKSVSGTITFIGDSPICWSSKRQTCISMSTMESELIALSSGCQDALWTRNLLRELTPESSASINLFCDNLPTVLQSKNLSNKPMSRHIELRYYFVRDLISKGLIQVDHISGQINPSDVLTKTLCKAIFFESSPRIKVSPPS